jgi:hypothetical protein
LESLGFNFLKRENGVEMSQCSSPGEVPGQDIEYSEDLKNIRGPSKSHWSSMQPTCRIIRIARMGKNECLQHAPEAREKISTIGPT